MNGAAQKLDLDDIQGLVFDGYDDLPHTYYVLYEVVDGRRARMWLAKVASLVRSARPRQPGASGSEHAIHLAFTADGFQALGFDENLLTGFSNEFQMGMNDGYRSRVLGDIGVNAPWYWDFGGVAPPASIEKGALGDRAKPTLDLAGLLIQPPVPASPPEDTSIHVMVMIFARSREHLDALLGEIEALGPQDPRPIVQAHEPMHSFLPPDRKEHFGFRDGISQPAVAGAGAPPTDGERPTAAGEFVLGYLNEYGELPASPLVPRGQDPGGLLPACTDPELRATHDFGRNGTYLVLRRLRQLVRAFWATMRKESAGDADPSGVRLASKLVGRWPSGAPLALAKDRDDPSLALANRFGYRPKPGEEDSYACPVGAHIRRANPRDTIMEAADDPSGKNSLDEARRHQIIRRGRPYGPPRLEQEDLVGEEHEARLTDEGWAYPRAFGHREDEDERGLMFLAINANLARQFEFIQQTWANNPKANRLRDEIDPLVGVDPDPIHEPPGAFTPNPDGLGFDVNAQPDGEAPHGYTLTIQKRLFSEQTRLGPRMYNLPTFVRMKGGAYFFMPGLRALKWLGTNGYASD